MSNGKQAKNGAAAPAPEQAEQAEQSAVKAVLVSAVSRDLRNPYTTQWFSVGVVTKAALDSWVASQLKAGLLVEEQV